MRGQLYVFSRRLDRQHPAGLRQAVTVYAQSHERATWILQRELERRDRHGIRDDSLKKQPDFVCHEVRLDVEGIVGWVVT